MFTNDLLQFCLRPNFLYPSHKKPRGAPQVSPPSRALSRKTDRGTVKTDRQRHGPNEGKTSRLTLEQWTLNGAAMYSCAGPRSLGQVCIPGITLGQLIQVGSSFGRISQSCLSDLSLFVLFHSTFLLKQARGGFDEDWSGEVEWCSGNILGISEPHRNIRNIGATSATTPLSHRPEQHWMLQMVPVLI